MIYDKIEGENYDKIFVVGDIHGCYDLLLSELEKVQFNERKDLLISTGDIIDRGEKSIECLSLIYESWFKMVIGNHEEFAIDCLLNGKDHSEEGALIWYYNGGTWSMFLSQEDKEEIKLALKRIDKFPIILEVNTKLGLKVVICHADYPSNEYSFNKEVDYEKVIWSRERITKYKHKNRSEKILGADIFIFGHTPSKEIKMYSNQIYLDTGSYRTNKLSLIRIQ